MHLKTRVYYKSVFTLYTFIAITSSQNAYWREYYGEIPIDAVPAGYTKEGHITYIGQALFENPTGKLIPGWILPGKGVISNWNNNEYSRKRAVKILCSSNSSSLIWLDTDNKSIKNLDEQKLVVGGYDTSYYLYIGKTFVDGSFIIGKVTISPPNDGLCYSYNKTSTCVRHHFLVLGYE